MGRNRAVSATRCVLPSWQAVVSYGWDVSGFAEAFRVEYSRQIQVASPFAACAMRASALAALCDCLMLPA